MNHNLSSFCSFLRDGKVSPVGTDSQTRRTQGCGRAGNESLSFLVNVVYHNVAAYWVYYVLFVQEINVAEHIRA